MQTRSSTLIFSLFLIFFIYQSFAQQTPKWRRLPGAPFLSSSRIDDAWFINPYVGWIANGLGQIWRTTNGGTTWLKQYDNRGVYFRSITFADSIRGWACNLGTEEFGGATDTNIIFQTTNSGLTWFPNNNISPRKPRGICGVQAIGDSFVYGVGRVRGPAFFIRSSDGGNTWQTRDMSGFVMGLLDVHFWTPDSGIICGHTGPVNESSSGRILFTSDRGTTWRTLFTTSRIGEWCWKINFPSRRIGYVSLQRNVGDTVNFLKTTDGGMTWQEKRFRIPAYYVQGIGFATETRGWLGGNSSSPSYGTTDGGATWFPDTIGLRMNRFRMLNDTIGYATGQGVYKYSISPVTGVSASTPTETPNSFVLLDVYPNPFNAQTTIEYTLTVGADDPATPLYLRLKVYEVLGREVAALLDEPKRAGKYRLQFNGNNLASGIYFLKLEAIKAYDNAPMLKGNYVATKKLLLLR